MNLSQQFSKDPKGMKIKGIHTYVSHDGTDIGTV